MVFKLLVCTFFLPMKRCFQENRSSISNILSKAPFSFCQPCAFGLCHSVNEEYHLIHENYEMFGDPFKEHDKLYIFFLFNTYDSHVSSSLDQPRAAFPSCHEGSWITGQPPHCSSMMGSCFMQLIEFTQNNHNKFKTLRLFSGQRKLKTYTSEVITTIFMAWWLLPYLFKCLSLSEWSQGGKFIQIQTVHAARNAPILLGKTDTFCAKTSEMWWHF